MRLVWTDCDLLRDPDYNSRSRTRAVFDYAAFLGRVFALSLGITAPMYSRPE
jgi:hypothetical protein